MLFQLSYSRKKQEAAYESNNCPSDWIKITLGGEGRIRTSEGIANRFTVCPLWPLGNLSRVNYYIITKFSVNQYPFLHFPPSDPPSEGEGVGFVIL